MIFTPASFVFVITKGHSRPSLTALRLRKPWYKRTTATCALFALQTEVNAAASGRTSS